MKRRNFIVDSAASFTCSLAPRSLLQALCVGGMTGAPASLATDQEASEETARYAFLKFVRESLSPLAYEEGHYQEYFDWRYRNLPQSRDLYDNFTVQFSHRHSLLARLLGCLGRRPFLSDTETEVLAEILLLFSKTDLLILQGYRAWPGTPRGYSSEERPGSDV